MSYIGLLWLGQQPACETRDACLTWDLPQEKASQSDLSGSLTFSYQSVMIRSPLMPAQRPELADQRDVGPERNATGWPPPAEASHLLKLFAPMPGDRADTAPPATHLRA